MKKKNIFYGIIVILILLVVISEIKYYFFTPQVNILVDEFCKDDFIGTKLFLRKKNIKLNVITITVLDLNGNFSKSNLNDILGKQDIDMIASLRTSKVIELINNNKLLNIEDYFNNDELENMAQSVVNTSRLLGNGKLYSLTPGFSSTVLIINNNIFKKLNIFVPTQPLSWNEVRAIADELEAANKEKLIFKDKEFSPIQLGPMDAFFFTDFEYIVKPTGVKFFSSDNKTIFSDEKLKNYFNFFGELHREYSIANIEEPFYEGKVAMTIVNKGLLEKAVKFNNMFDCTILPMPYFEEDKYLNYATFSTIGVNKNTQNLENSIRTLKELMSKEYAEYMLKHDYFAVSGPLTTYYDEDIKNIYAKRYPKFNMDSFYKGSEGFIWYDTDEVFNTEEEWEIYVNYRDNALEQILNTDMDMEEIYNELKNNYAEGVKNGKKQ